MQLDGTQSHSGHFGKEKNLLLPLQIDCQIVQPAA
jgi:hypothetical protein